MRPVALSNGNGNMILAKKSAVCILQSAVCKCHTLIDMSLTKSSKVFYRLLRSGTLRVKNLFLENVQVVMYEFFQKTFDIKILRVTRMQCFQLDGFLGAAPVREQ